MLKGAQEISPVSTAKMFLASIFIATTLVLRSHLKNPPAIHCFPLSLYSYHRLDHNIPMLKTLMMASKRALSDQVSPYFFLFLPFHPYFVFLSPT